MSKREKILILIVLLVAIIPIIINEIKIRPKLNLINDVKKILKNIDTYKDSDEEISKEYLIDNGYTIDGKNYKVNGHGVIFIDKNSSVFLNRNGMCAMKLPYSEEVMIQYEECPVYRMFNGIKTPIATKDSGLFQNSDSYIYKGTELNNYVIYKDDLWNILSFEDGNVKIIKSNYDKFSFNGVEDLYSKLNEKYSKILGDEMILESTWNIESIDTSNDNFVIIDKEITSKIGILSVSDYLNSLISKYDINNNIINISEASYLSKEMVLSTNNAYLKGNANVYINSDNKIEKIYPVILLSKDAIFDSGSGTKQDPYKLRETE